MAAPATAREFSIVDVFTSQRFAGNQLAVVPDAKGLSTQQMQSITREFNFSETCFVTQRAGADRFRVRIFTPGREVPFAGHPLLGTAHVLLGPKPRQRGLTLVTKAGPIPVWVGAGPGPRRLWMRQPKPTFGKILRAAPVAKALGLSTSAIRKDWPIQEVSTGFNTIMVPLNTLKDVAACRVDRPQHDRVIAATDAKDFFVFAPARRGTWEARCFAPYFGIAEDPATGSANGAFAAYLAQRGVLTTRNPETLVHQGRFVGRPSALHLRATPEGNSHRIEVGGSVADFANGRFQEGQR